MPRFAQKWNPKLKVYVPYELPAEAVMYSSNMDEPIQCAQCGKVMTYGEGYTSKQVHNSMGFGYIVCDGCYEKELGEE